MDGLAERERDRVAPYPSEAQLLDVLYEVLAQGLPAPADVQDGALSRADVERFLHEHARTPKPREELLRFLSVHGLPVEPSEVSADHELALLARGLQRAQRSASLPAPMLPVVLDEDDDASGDEVENEATSPRLVAPAFLAQPLPAIGVRSLRTIRRLPRAWIALCAVVLGLAVVLLLSHLHAERLAARLATAQAGRRFAEQRESHLRAEVQRLRSELAARGRERDDATAQLRAELAARDQAYAVAAARYAAETSALEHAFGPRHRLARRQLAKVGVLPPF